MLSYISAMGTEAAFYVLRLFNNFPNNTLTTEYVQTLSKLLFALNYI